MPIKKCKICNNRFYAKPFFLRNGKAKYCSLKCMGLDKRKGKIFNCFSCDKEIYKTKKAINKSKSKKYFCSKSCQTKWRNTEFTGEKHSNWKGGVSTYKDILIRNKIPQMCKFCKKKDIRILAVHHIDRNRKNNNLSNLTWLCHNCHHLVHHDKKERDKFMETLV